MPFLFNKISSHFPKWCYLSLRGKLDLDCLVLTRMANVLFSNKLQSFGIMSSSCSAVSLFSFAQTDWKPNQTSKHQMLRYYFALKAGCQNQLGTNNPSCQFGAPAVTVFAKWWYNVCGTVFWSGFKRTRGWVRGSPLGENTLAFCTSLEETLCLAWLQDTKTV